MENNLNFSALLRNMLSRLSEREQDVLRQRYQLSPELKQIATLKEIGDNYQITRERVRQIERESVKKLVAMRGHADFAAALKELEFALSQYIERGGGLVRQDELLNSFIQPNYNWSDLHPNAYFFAMEHLFDSVEKIEDHKQFYTLWKLTDLKLEHVTDLISKVENELRTKNTLFSESEIIDLAKNNLSAELKTSFGDYLNAHTDLNHEKLLIAYLNAASSVEKNILNQWGLSEWQKIRPKKLADKIMLVFEKETKPLHFRDIAEKINQAGFDRKSICPATVHNELIANTDYVLIGRGIYALKNWGYTTGTVEEIIERILGNVGKAMTKEEIIQEVLKQRQVNRSTVYLTLINKDQFERDNEGKYYLVK